MSERLKTESYTEPQNQLEYIEYNRKLHSYSHAVDRLFTLALTYIDYAEEENAKGHQAAWTQGVFDAPLLLACDTIPTSAIDLGRLSAGDSSEVSQKEFDLPKETCSMISVLLGEWLKRKDNTLKKVVAYNNTCEPFNMAYDLIKQKGFDVFRVESVILPKTNYDGRYDELKKFLMSELNDVAVWLTGKDINEEKLGFEIRRMNRILKKVRRIMDLRVKNPLYLKSLPTMFMLMGTGHYYGRPEEFEDILDELIREMEKADYIEPKSKRVIPLTWCGARGIEFGVFKAIDDCEGALLSWYTPNPYDKDWREDIPPLEAMAEFVLDYFLVGSPVHQIQGIENLMKKVGSKGLFFYNYVGCAFGSVHVGIFRNYFKKKNVPSIDLDGSFQVGQPSGQLLTRVRAFIEMFE